MFKLHIPEKFIKKIVVIVTNLRPFLKYIKQYEVLFSNVVTTTKTSLLLDVD